MDFETVWHNFLNWLRTDVPELKESLLPGMNEAEVRYLEEGFGHPFPPAMKSFLMACGGQARGARIGLFDSFMLDQSGILDEWQKLGEMATEFANNPNAHIDHEAYFGPVQHLPGCRGWIPFAADFGEEVLYFDLEPAVGGQVGQILRADYGNQRLEVAAPGIVEFIQMRWEALRNPEP